MTGSVQGIERLETVSLCRKDSVLSPQPPANSHGMARSMTAFYRDLKLGILGGGQLGRMLLQSAIDFDLHTSVLDPHPEAPARRFCSAFTAGDFRDENTVLAFGKDLDILTIEIEDVNTAALQQLADDGKQVFPQPEVIAMVQDKGEQKNYYKANGFPTSDYTLVQDKTDLEKQYKGGQKVLKLRRGGFDGRGVMMLNTTADIKDAFDAPCVLEDRVEIAAEMAVLCTRNRTGEVRSYPPVGMHFSAEANLLEFLMAPADLSPGVLREATGIAQQLVAQLGMVGLLAVELFLDTQGKLWINEIAPRPHNSGHHTMDACVTSQFEQHLRSILGLALGDTRQHTPAAMLNLLGESGHRGAPIYHAIEQVLEIPGVKLHLYGKAETRPFRKMGHLSVLDPDPTEAVAKVRRVQGLIRVEAM